ncbi:hypothetical protein [Campylobacter showae]|nr:hypothetical protein [Campylobacter showae]
MEHRENKEQAIIEDKKIIDTENISTVQVRLDKSISAFLERQGYETIV